MARARHTVARHARLTSPTPLSQILKLLAVAVAVVLVSTGGVAAFASYDLVQSYAEGTVVIEDQPPVPPDIGAIEGGVNVLVTGIDECEPEYAHFFADRCTGESAEDKLNDVNLLVHISDAPRRVTVVSFPRDLVVEMPACTRAYGSRWDGGTEQINSAYYIGGLSCVQGTISKLSGMPIHFSAVVTFGGVIEITNAIGGVDVCVQDAVRDSETGLDLTPGTHTVSGYWALQFLRTRYGVGDGSDLGRTSNQQQYMGRLARKLVSEEVLSNPATLYRLASTALSNVRTSESLQNPMTLAQVAPAVKDVPFDEIVFVTYPAFDHPYDVNRLVPDYDSAAGLWAALDSNKKLKITGDVGARGAVVEVTPDAAPVPEASDAPVEDVVELPSSIAGSTAAQELCSAQWREE